MKPGTCFVGRKSRINRTRILDGTSNPEITGRYGSVHSILINPGAPCIFGVSTAQHISLVDL